MAQKVTDIANAANKYDILSQTPGNYSKDNYFLRELQEKVNADWEYRPNRALIEYEDTWGAQTYAPIEVVLQSVISEKGTAISSDTRNVVFRNIHESRFTIGNRFRFSPDFNIASDARQKDTWLVINSQKTNLTASVIIQRCNGTLGSTWVDDQNVTHYHYEPVIQGMDLSSVSLFFNEVAVSPQSQLLVIAQHNEYTRNYFINQRFIVGYDKVYRIKAINKFYSNSTNNPEDVGLMRIYLELTESSVYDDFNTRIAYQMTPEIHPTVDPTAGGLYFAFRQPDIIPTDLTSTLITFEPYVKRINSDEEITGLDIRAEARLTNLPANVNPNDIMDKYFTLVNIGGGQFTLKRNRIYLNGELEVRFYVPDANSDEGILVETKFTMVMNRKE